MIYDHISNIALYKGLSPELDTALDFIARADATSAPGVIMLEGGVKIIISENMTALVNEKGYEAHRQFIDVQIALSGRELIRCKPLPQVEETIPYSDVSDAARYADCPGADMIIGDGYFLVVFPDDAHEPLLAADGKPELVKKIVAKVPWGGMRTR